MSLQMVAYNFFLILFEKSLGNLHKTYHAFMSSKDYL